MSLNRNAIDQMIDLAKIFFSDVNLSKDCNERYIVSINRVSWKANRNDIMSRSLSGYGGNLVEACLDFMNKAKGKLLFGDDKSFYGENRPEYICV